MDIKKIYLFASTNSQYGVIDHFTNELAAALTRQGIISPILVAEHDNPGAFIDQILSDPPDCTLSFNGLLPDAQGRFLCDLIDIPHVAYLTDAPNHFFPLIQSHRNILACIDQDFCQIFQSFQFPHVLFLPHAIAPSVEPTVVVEPLYDILMLNSYIDYEAIRQHWMKNYSPEICAVLEEAADWAIQDVNIVYMQAFIQTLDKHLKMGKAIDPRQIDYEEILNELEAYMTGKSHIELLNSIREGNIHIFGSQEGEGWKKHLREGATHVHVHESVPFAEALELMKRAKIVINNTPKIKRGLHERMLNALACGAAVLTLDTPFMREQFKDEEEILLYQPQEGEALNRKLHLYLNDEPKRQQLVAKGRAKVMQQHTWDQRAQTLIRELPQMLAKIKDQK